MNAAVNRELAFVFATWFGCGRVPIMPGTAGTLGAIPLYLLLRPHGPVVVLVVAALLGVVGVWAANEVIEATGEKDPQIVVIDEVVGVLVTLAACSASFASVAAGVVFFRVFDQWKPWPARTLESLSGGWGVMMDDVAAGVWGAVVLGVMRMGGLL